MKFVSQQKLRKTIFAVFGIENGISNFFIGLLSFVVHSKGTFFPLFPGQALTPPQKYLTNMSPKDTLNRHLKSSSPHHGSHLSDLATHLVAATGEFVGTFFFLWMAYSGQLTVLNQYSALAVAGGASSETIVFIALVYALSLLVNAWAFYRISGGLFNPAVGFLYLSPATFDEM